MKVLRTSKQKFRSPANAMVIVVMAIALMMLVGLGFLVRSNNYISFSGLLSDQTKASLKMEAAYEKAKAKLERAVNGIVLVGKLPCVNNALANESFFQIQPNYEGNELQFLKDVVQAESYDGSCNQDVNSEFKSFDSAFPTQWTSPDGSNNQYYQVKYSFNPMPISYTTGTNPNITFRYEYVVEARAYGSKQFSESSAQDAGLVTISLDGAPFSQWSLFRSQTKSPNGWNLYFAGGNTSSQIQEVFYGPVHTNSRPNFYGHPVFKDTFSSGVTEGTNYSNWNLVSTSSYTGPPVFDGGTQSGGDMNTDMPTQIFNTIRLAAGDPSADAATNNDPVDEATLAGFLTNYAGGTLAGSTVPDGIYVPIDNQTDKDPTGGVYVAGDAKVSLNVVQGEGADNINSSYWANIKGGDQTCKFEKIHIDHTDAGVPIRDIFVGDDPCNVTYVFNADSPTDSPVVLSKRINGNIHVSGSITELGGESRTRPAVATGFAMTVSAMKDVSIKKDLQYEDAKYVSLDSSGNLGTTEVADPYGTVGDPTQADLAAQISSDSTTVLGIISIKRNVKIHQDAVSNINIHAAIYAGNGDAYDGTTGYGCGSSYPGCGFGVEGWNTVSGRGNLKLFGSVSEYRSQITGSLASGTGYQRRYMYDSRLKQSIMPPAFVISDFLQAYPRIEHIKTWRVGQAK